MRYKYIHKSLKKHRITPADVNEVLAASNSTTRDFDMELSSEENLRIMFVDFNLTGRLLEIGVEFLSEDEAIVFHGQAVSPTYRQLYEAMMANE